MTLGAGQMDHRYLSFPICHTVPMSQGVCGPSNWARLMSGTHSLPAGQHGCYPVALDLW